MIKKLFVPIFLFLFVVVVTARYMFTRKAASPRVVTTIPTSGGTHNPFLPVIITLDRGPAGGAVSITVAPETQTSVVFDGNIMRIVPKTSFVPETSYTIQLNTSPPYTLSFTTETNVESAPGYNEQMEKSFQQYKQQNGAQDAALADVRTHSPVSGDGFIITYSYKNNTYTVGLDSPVEQNKIKFLAWLAQKGITRLDDLRITYVER